MNTANITGVQHIALPAKNLNATIRFYEGLGFSVAHRTATPDGNPVVFLKLGRRPCEKSEWENEEESLLRMGCVRDWLWYEISEESSSIVDSEFDEMVLMSCSLSSFTI